MDIPIIQRCIDNRLTVYKERILQKLDDMKGVRAKPALKSAVKKANPYYLKFRFGGAKAKELVEYLVRDQFSKTDETIFGNTMELFAYDIASCNRQYNEVINEGDVLTGLDKLRVDDDRKIVYMDEDKSSPHWANSKAEQGLRSVFAKQRPRFYNDTQIIQLKA